VLGRAPVLVVPAEVAVEERQVRVDLVVGLVPTVLLRHRHPPGDLAPLGLDARQPVVEHARHAVLDGERPAAPRTAKRVALRRERRAADGAAEDVEGENCHGDALLCTGKDEHTAA
jgi:hypothetical protein